MRTKRGAALIALTWLVPTTLLAQTPPPPPGPGDKTLVPVRAEPPPPTRSYQWRHVVRAKIMLGAGGDMGMDQAGGAQIAFRGRPSVSAPMHASAAFGLQYEYPIHRYILVGGLLGFGTWNNSFLNDSRIERSWFVDVDVVARARYPLMDGKIELYVSLPLGLSVSPLDDKLGDLTGTDWSTGIGWNIGLHAGVQWYFYRFLGAFFEFGWTYRGFGGRTTERLGGLTGEYDWGTHQAALSFGVVAAF